MLSHFFRSGKDSSLSSNSPAIKGSQIKGTFWLKHLPLELLLNIMTLLSRNSLESLISILDIDFTGVVRYVVDTSLQGKKSSKIRTVRLEDLDHDITKTMINIIVIENTSNLDIDLTLSRVTGSFNFFSLSNVKFNVEYPLILRENIIEKLLVPNKLQKYPTTLQVANSDELEVRHRDVTHTSFSNINDLVLMCCKVGERPLQFVTSNVKVLRLFLCSGKVIYPKTFRQVDGLIDGAILRDISINSGEVRIIGSEVMGLLFSGTVLRHFSLKKNIESLNLTKVRAPKLLELSIRFYKSFPIVMDFYAPQLSDVKIFKRPEESQPFFFNNDRQDTPNRYHFLRSVHTLELRFFWEPLYKVDFQWLCTLTLHIHRNLVPVQNEFLRLKSFNLHLLGEVNMVPIIRAKNLRYLNLIYYKTMAEWTFLQARSFYPCLLRFSLRHRVWNYFD